MRVYTVTELTNKVFETPEGVIIQGVMFRGLHLSRLMALVTGLSDTELDAVNRFCRALTIEQQQEAIEGWSK